MTQFFFPQYPDYRLTWDEKLGKYLGWHRLFPEHKEIGGTALETLARLRKIVDTAKDSG